MSQPIVVVAAIFGILASSPGANAQGSELWSGNGLLKGCESQNPTFENGICYGYLKGMRDSHDILLAKSWCVPQAVQLNQIRLIVVKYMKEHPELLHLDFDEIAKAAIVAAFPCK